MLENGDLLRNISIENGEVAFVERTDQLARRILHRDQQTDQLHVDLEVRVLRRRVREQSRASRATSFMLVP